ncbi:hypothetical protein PG997_011091 [Apiospora hydei]|uniref:Uncharacterized protein n=1 Tax=Apiospora hydei TaxID=1337664 RepID=A0ABR1VI14_9PEZI
MRDGSLVHFHLDCWYNAVAVAAQGEDMEARVNCPLTYMGGGLTRVAYLQSALGIVQREGAVTSNQQGMKCGKATCGAWLGLDRATHVRWMAVGPRTTLRAPYPQTHPERQGPFRDAGTRPELQIIESQDVLSLQRYHDPLPSVGWQRHQKKKN